MKTILMTVLAFLSLTVALAQSNNAERKAPRKMTHEEMTTKMVSQLKLNDAQKTKVAALNKEYQDYLMPEPPQGEGPDKNGEKPDMKKPGNKKPGTDNHQGKRQEYEKKLKKILTDDQYKSYQKMGPRGNGKARRGSRSSGR